VHVCRNACCSTSYAFVASPACPSPHESMISGGGIQRSCRALEGSLANMRDDVVFGRTGKDAAKRRKRPRGSCAITAAAHSAPAAKRAKNKNRPRTAKAMALENSTFSTPDGTLHPFLTPTPCRKRSRGRRSSKYVQVISKFQVTRAPSSQRPAEFQIKMRAGRKAGSSGIPAITAEASLFTTP
jgi:hypothetical protein